MPNPTPTSPTPGGRPGSGEQVSAFAEYAARLNLPLERVEQRLDLVGRFLLRQSGQGVKITKKEQATLDAMPRVTDEAYELISEDERIQAAVDQLQHSRGTVEESEAIETVKFTEWQVLFEGVLGAVSSHDAA